MDRSGDEQDGSERPAKAPGEGTIAGGERQQPGALPGADAGWLAGMMKQSAPVMGAAYSLTGGLIGFGLLGYCIDLYFGTSPAALLVGLGLGLLVGFYELAKVVFGGSRTK